MKHLPIISIQIESMKHIIQHLLAEQACQLDSMVNEAVDTYCSSENLERVVSTSVQTEINRAIEEEIRSFYSRGDGRATIKKLVVETLSRKY